MLNDISQQISGNTSDPPSATFQADVSDIRVNIFWILSLAFSLQCALMAILVQQWARNYIHATTTSQSPSEAARIRSYIHEGVQDFGLEAVVTAVPTLLHISVNTLHLSIQRQEPDLSTLFVKVVLVLRWIIAIFLAD